MANLQVGAATSQAVGAFDALTASIMRAKGAFDNLEQQLNRTTTASTRLHSSLGGNMVRAFEALQAAASTLYGWLSKLYAGFELVFNSLLKEIDKIQGFNAVMSVTTGSTQKAGEQFQFLRRMADVLGVQFDALSNNYAKLVAAIPEGNRQLDIAQRVFLGVAMAARTLHATNQDTQLMFYAVTQIASKGVVSMEELRRQLGEKLPGALQIAARAVGTNTTELEAAIRKGVVNSAKFLDLFADELIRTFFESSKIASTSISAAVNRLTNVWVDFVKAVLDSGAAKSIINVFDALREKLSDPYVISNFATVVKIAADQVTGFIKNLTDSDVRSGFDQFARLVSGVTTIVGALVKSLTWIIDNSGKVGAVIGAIKGGQYGAAAGTAVAPGPGTVIGGSLGAVLGGIVGAAISGGYRTPSAEEINARMAANSQAANESYKLKENQRYWQNYIRQMVEDSFKMSMSQVPSLMSPEMATQDVANQILQGWSDPRYRTLKERQEALLGFARFGRFLGPRGRGIQDVLGGPGKPSREARAEESAFLRSLDYSGNFIREWERLNAAYSHGAYGKPGSVEAIEALTAAQKDLIDEQPRFAKALRETESWVRADNRAATEFADTLERFTDRNRDAIYQLSEGAQSAGLTARQRFVNAGVRQFDEEAQRLRERYAEDDSKVARINETVDARRIERVTALNNAFTAQTDALNGLKDASQSYFDQLQNGARQAADSFTRMTSTMQNMWEQFVMTGKFKFIDFVRMIQLEIAKITWTKYIGPAAGGLAGSIVGALLGLERGGVMTSAGPMNLPTNMYSSGGVADSPQVAIYGEGRKPEAYVPLPDGRSIPVSIVGRSGEPSVNIYQTVYAGSNLSRSELGAAMMATKNAAVSEVRETLRRRRQL